MSLEQILQTVEHLANVVNEHQRRLDNIIIPGKVKALSDDNKSVVIEHGSCFTPEIKWFAPAAGGVIEYRAPSVGEQCLLINLTGGKDTSACIALVGVTSENFDFTEANPYEHITKYPDGSKIGYNHADKKLTLDLAGEANINTEGNTTVTVDGDATVSATKILLNSAGTSLEEVLNRKAICALTGSPHMTCGNTVFVGSA
jgi:phage baseplate assembly protein V